MNLAVWTPRILSVLRIMTGLLFLEHGTGKLLGFPSSDHSASSLLSLIGFQGVLELAGGLLILLGLFTRPVAFVLAGDMRDIIVSHPESGLSVTYRKDGDAPMLVAIEGIDEIDRFDQARLNFLAKAWKAAHAKALAVGWLQTPISAAYRNNQQRRFALITCSAYSGAMTRFALHVWLTTFLRAIGSESQQLDRLWLVPWHIPPRF